MSVVPVTYEASSEVRNRTHAATSSGVPMRRAGIASTIPFPMSCVSLVYTNPGATAFTVIPRLATSTATVFVKPIRPAFDAA